MKKLKINLIRSIFKLRYTFLSLNDNLEIIAGKFIV